MERKTFKNESTLPSLPIPDIEETLDSYQISQKAILSSDDYDQFLKVLENFKSSGQAQECQDSFIQKFDLNSYPENSANWLEKLHEDKAYLEFRGPLYYLNIFGTVYQPSDYQSNPAVPESYSSPQTKIDHQFDFNKISRIIYGTLK